MRPPVLKTSPAAGKSRHGVALVLTLAILAILSVLLVSFLSMASLDRGATKSYAQALQAEQIAMGGLDQIISQFQAEIADPQLSVNHPSVTGGTAYNLYIPLSGSNAVPQRTAPNLPNLAALLNYSGTSLYTAGAGAANYSSDSLTQSKSLNGRSISIARWNKPQLTTGTTGFPVPKWVLMTRSGPQAAGSYSSDLANSSLLNDKYVVGRYAYVVYDTGGLLDANVAGYPSGAAASAPGKGLMPWADLTQLDSAKISSADVDRFVQWRNAATWSNYAANVHTSATGNGFTRVAKGDTCFLSRQELIKYAQTQNPALVSALPYLTTFSREVNGPTWGPSLPADYAAKQYTAETLNPRIPNPRVQAVFTRANGLPAAPGEPLVKYRFPLDKLALLEKFTGTGTGTLSATDIADIQKYFGLDYAADANGPSFRHWVYPTQSRSGNSAAGILTLDQVAQLNREPDFFELLQAGILGGSLGVSGRNTTAAPSGFVDPDSKLTLQVLRIGANIMDQWDADSFPTTITLSPGPGEISVYGVEDLPYPFAAFLNFYGPNPSAPPFYFYIYFELWNPHQISGGSATGYPQEFRLSPLYNSALSNDSDSFLAGFSCQVKKLPPLTGSFSAVWDYNGSTQLAAQNLGDPAQPQQITFGALASDYREPALIPGTTAGAPSPLDTIACFTPAPLTSFPKAGTPAYDIASIPSVGTAKFPSDLTTLMKVQVKVSMSLAMRIQYKDKGGNWRTYGTFMGMDDTGGSFSAGTGFFLNGIWNVSSTASLNTYSLVKSDPRTSRFGAGFNGLGASSNDTNQPLASSGGAMNNPVTSYAPFGAGGVAGNAPYRLDMWAVNDSTVSVPSPSSGSPYYSDTDGVQRWGDARNAYKLQNASPLFTGKMANRPVILNRPFQSVGELGYVFRDMPWKSLDLFSANSADSGLLDLFTLSNAPVVAGRVSPNTPYPQVLAALLSGANQSAAAGSVSSSQALTAAQAMQTTAAGAPFVNRADLVNQFMTNAAIATLAPSGIKTEAEVAVRAVAESANTRTWNFLIDIIAQAGRYPPGTNAASGGLDHFAVDGERRYWLHVAIDRYTGQVIDKQLEVVNE
ncbi:MAG: hypothetical protein PHQ12_07870 [Chthoniobacteraceae bacterium]|nr:hypothetical protein [Chthoniobacteraceae bacterium]